MGTLEDLVKAIQEEVEEARSMEEDFPYGDLFHKAVNITVREVAEGADSEDFVALVMVNFLLKAVDAGATPDGIRTFLRENGVLPTAEVEAKWEAEEQS